MNRSLVIQYARLIMLCEMLKITIKKRGLHKNHNNNNGKNNYFNYIEYHILKS